MPPAEVAKAAMIIGAMPAPPLPMIVCKEVPDEISFVSGEEHVANTHDLMALLMLQAMGKDNEQDRQNRNLCQKNAVGALFESMRAIDESQLSTEKLQNTVYDLFCVFTRASIAGLSGGKDDVRFKELRSIQREDRIHIASTHHAVIQDIVYGYLPTDPGGLDKDKRPAAFYGDYPYASLMMRQYARVKECLLKESEGKMVL